MPARDRGEKDDDRLERDHDRDRDRDRRRRSRSRDRGGERGGDRSERRSRRTRSRSRSPTHKRKRSPSSASASTAGPSGKHEEPPMSQMTEEERQMKELLGFGAFHSTKGKKVDGNNVGGVHVIMKRKYRQYMNRKGGFNRPLDFVA